LSGTINGTVVDPSGAGNTLLLNPSMVMGGVTVALLEVMTTGLGDQSDQSEVAVLLNLAL